MTVYTIYRITTVTERPRTQRCQHVEAETIRLLALLKAFCTVGVLGRLGIFAGWFAMHSERQTHSHA